MKQAGKKTVCNAQRQWDVRGSRQEDVRWASGISSHNPCTVINDHSPVEGRGTGERVRVRVPVGMSDKSTEGEKRGTGGGSVKKIGVGIRWRKVGTCKRAQTEREKRRD